MNFIDGILGILLLIGSVKGFQSGFFIELASLVSIWLGILIAIKFSYVTREFLVGHGSWNPNTIQVTSFALTFILVVIGVSIIAKILTRVATFGSLGGVNKILGGFFGILKTMLMISIVLNLFQKINSGFAIVSKKTTENSKLYHPVQHLSKIIYPSIEDWFEVIKSNGIEADQPSEKIRSFHFLDGTTFYPSAVAVG